MNDSQVLIAGAGPTGLVLALFLTRQGVRVRIIDPAALPETTSRALAVQARTLEYYRQVGMADAVVERAARVTRVNLWVAGRPAAHVELGALGVGLSPFPYMTIFPQDEHEQLLIERLAAEKVTVERGTSLTSFKDANGRVQVQLKHADGNEETCDVSYLAGCDGAHSVVRTQMRTTFPGGTYDRLFFVADVTAGGPVADGQLHVALDDADFLAVFPMKGTGRARFIGSILKDAATDGTPLTWDDVSHKAMDRLRATVAKVNWFSTYRVHHRVADHFRQGRVFLLGDAAHIHSPVGGQGMNTGVGDAVNLAWKLAAALNGSADARVLDCYEPERMAFARRLVQTTDRVFSLVTNNGALARFVRLGIVPHLIPALAAFEFVRRFMFRTVSQIAVQYRLSILSAGRVGCVHGGDRLPWVAPDNATPTTPDNFSPLTSLDWQVHVYGDASSAITTICAAHALPLHVFPWRPETERAGLDRNALYLVRPDGYVALVALADPAATLEHYLGVWKIHSRPTG